ncbi:restriction endonuclease [Massilia sp. CFBP9012]|uniref:restriction endonuclease n=1 Tax=Massilia sp. CFBP9012 TaxID=3096531 RepID=UPI002A6B2A1C|nr:restriction endonuclease [Massilia sp. CFBP9012]MDY0977733.1 restriction endonuclease [Massilia sp. CFBP9012]
MRDELKGLMSDGAMLLDRINYFSESGRHWPSMQENDQLKLWFDAFSVTGASPELIRAIDLGLTVPRKLSSADAALLDKLAHARLQQGDRFIVMNNDGYDTELPYRLFSRAVQLEPLVANKLEGVIYAFTVLGNFDRRDFQRHSSIVEACIPHMAQVKALLSESRWWRADGSINSKKVIGLLRDQVSPALSELTDAEVQVLARAWRNSGGAAARTSPADQGEAFERQVALVFEACGMQVQTTPRTGDYGVDLVVASGQQRLAIQVKDLAGPAGIAAVQEVSAGALHYGCTGTVVVSNNGFTDAARTLANATNTRLITLHALRHELNRHILNLLTM